MKIRADEHVSEQIVRAVRDLALSPGFELSHVVAEGDRGARDEHWLVRFAAQGGHAILTADTDFFKLPQQAMAVFDTGIRVIHLPSKWASAPGHLQCAHILLWWLRIEAAVATSKPRQCWRPVWNIRDDGELQLVPINFEEHRRKLKKSERSRRKPQ